MKGALNELALFAGAGGGILGSTLLGHRIVCAVEWDAYCQAVLLQRQKDGILHAFPIWDDVRTFDGAKWRGKVDVVSGGFPCQPFSTAGKRKGSADDRNMWPDTIRIIREVRPQFAFLENVPGLLNWDGGKYFGVILSDLHEAGYDAEWDVIGADDVGAPHHRKRLWILAYPKSQRPRRGPREICETDGRQEQRKVWESVIPSETSGNVAHPELCGCVHGQTEVKPTKARFDAQRESISSGSDVADTERLDVERYGSAGEQEPTIRQQAQTPQGGQPAICNTTIERLQDGPNREIQQSRPNKKLERSDWWTVEPPLGRVAHGVADRVGRLKAIGNGQVPRVVVEAWNTLMDRMEDKP